MAFHPSTCPFCSCGCGLLLQEERGRLVASHPAGRPPAESSLCIRGWNCTSAWSHRDRLTSPMVRDAAGLVRTGGREAVGEIVARLAGARVPPLFVLGPSLANEDAFAVRRLAERLGGRIAGTDLGGAPVARRALLHVLGKPYGLPGPDAIEQADLVWLFGFDAADCPQVASRVTSARRRGACLARFDVHVPDGDGSRVVTLVPGHFGQAARLLQQVAFEADLVAPEARRADGFDALARQWHEAAGRGGDAPTTRIDEARALASELRAAARPVAILGARWLTSRDAEHATVDLLQALALLGAGDRVVAAIGEANSWGVLDVLGPGSMQPAELACLEDGLDTLFVVGDDPIRRSPRPAAMADLLSRLSTVVVLDRFVTDSTPFAHVVLPSCGFAETDGSLTSLFGEVQRWHRIVAPPGDCAPERVWAARIAAALHSPSALAAFGPADEVFQARSWFETLQREVEGYRDVPAAQLYGEGDEAEAPAARVAGSTRLAFSRLDVAATADPAPADERYALQLVIGSLPANWSTGVVSQRDEILRRETVDSILSASPSTLKDAGVKPGGLAKLSVPGGEATVTVRADARLPGGVVVLVPLAGSPSAGLRGCYAGAGRRSVGVQPVPARIERV